MKILIADDDAVARFALEHGVRALGHDVLTADDGDACVRLYEAAEPDVCIIDWMMPGVDGLEATARIRALPNGELAYIVMLTARAEPEHMIHALRGGVDEFIAKPVERPELEARLNAAARLVRLQRSLAAQVGEVTRLNDALRRSNAELDRLASVDALTGLPNRRVAFERLRTMADLSQRYARPLSIAVIDIDRFKSINDTLGHASGDRVLATVASVLDGSRRRSDLVARIGGEEFVVAMPETGAALALESMQRLRRAVAEHAIAIDGAPIGVTVSIGVSTLRPDEPLEDWFGRADRALYDAKAAGRDRVVIDPADVPAPVGARTRAEAS